MELRIFSVYDAKAESFLQPVFFDSKGIAIRQFDELCNDPNHQFCKYAADFTLFELGIFNKDKGDFDLHLAPLVIANGIEFRRVERLVNPVPSVV